MAPPSRTQQCQRLNKTASNRRMMMMMMMIIMTTKNSPSLHPEKPAQCSAALAVVCRTRLRRLKDTLRSKGAWQQVTRIDDLCHTHVSPTWLHAQEVSLRRMTTSPTCRRDLVKELGRALANDACVDHSWTPSSSTVSPAAPPKPLGDTTRAFTPFWED